MYSSDCALILKSKVTWSTQKISHLHVTSLCYDFMKPSNFSERLLKHSHWYSLYSWSRCLSIKYIVYQTFTFGELSGSWAFLIHISAAWFTELLSTTWKIYFIQVCNVQKLSSLLSSSVHSGEGLTEIWIFRNEGLYGAGHQKGGVFWNPL